MTTRKCAIRYKYFLTQTPTKKDDKLNFFNELVFCKDCKYVQHCEDSVLCTHLSAVVQTKTEVNLVTGAVSVVELSAEKMRTMQCGYDGTLFEAS